MNEEVLEDSTPLKELYDRVHGVMPTQKDLEPLLEMDRDEKKVNLPKICKHV
jgi:ankyrin repeat-rich membrane spanning protein